MKTLFRIGSYERILQKVKMRKISWFKPIDNVSRHDTLSNTTLQGSIGGTKKIGRPKRNWMEDVYERIGISTRNLLDVTKYRYSWKKRCMTL